MAGMRHRLACALALAALLSSLAAHTPAAAQDSNPADMPWSVQSRFGGDANGDGRLDQSAANQPAALDVFPVLLHPSEAVCAAAEGADWLLDGEPVVPTEALSRAEGECQARLDVRGEGVHRIEVRTAKRSERARVEIDDRLVVALGDSVASGEGNPDAQGQWLDRPCHRSAAAGFEQATRLLAEALDRKSITFVSLACSGATVFKGLLEPYAGIAPSGRTTYTPQVARLEQLGKARGGAVGTVGTVDAVLVSVGANDVHFSEVVKSCAGPGDCQDRHDEQVFAELEALSRRYDTLQERLDQAAPGAPVLITEYFDPTRDERGEFCRWSVGLTKQAEARWAYEALLRPLNVEVAAAARRNGWQALGGIAADFGRHGYCSNEVERWIRRLGKSLLSQGDLTGTLHPNEKGHVAIANRVARRLDETLGLGVRPEGAEEEEAEEGRSTLAWIAIVVGIALALAALAWLALALAHSPRRDWPLLVLLWLLALVVLGLAAVALPLVLAALVLQRLWRLVRPTKRDDPCPEEPAAPELPALAPGSPVQLLVIIAVVAVIIVLAVLFTGVVGSAILWVRFWAARLPADQAVDAVSRSELVTTGTQALAWFAVLGLIALVVAWLIDGKGQWVRASRRGLVAIVVVEVLVAVLLGDYRQRQALELIGGLVVAALLFHFLLDRALELGAVMRAKTPLGHALLVRLKRLFGRRDGEEPRFRWRLVPLRALPLLLLALALYQSFEADGPDRWLLVLLPILLAAVLFVLPGGLAGSATASRKPGQIGLAAFEPPRIALALTAAICVLVLLTRDEAWLAASAGIALLLALACLAVAGASGERFAPYGIAVLLSVPVFGAATTMLRAVDSPEVQPVAVILDGGKALCGTYVGESDGRLWLGRIELSELAHVRRPQPRRGRIFPVDTDAVAERTIGPLQPVARAQDQALVLRDELLTARDERLNGPGEENSEEPEATCVAKPPAEEADASWQRDLAERYQPELVVDRRDRFWPIPVRTLFAMQDRRARACRLVAGSPDDGDCVRLTTQGELPWTGGQGEAIEYPAANERVDEQHDLMTDALGSVDPVRSAREYFLVAGEQGDDRPVTLQYWFFYSFNYQPLNRFGGIASGGFHEGDFESVGVLLSARTHRPRYVWMARHNDEGRIFPWDDQAVLKIDDHPRVFVARGSHASYESCERQTRFAAPGGLIDDNPTCVDSRQMHFPPEATPMVDLSRVAWGCWHGHFGHRTGDRTYEQVPHLVNDAPLSPLWQQRFDGVVSEPCRGAEDPGDREGQGEEVVEEEQGTPAALRRDAGRLEPLVDECSDWETAPADGAYMVACDQDALRAYVESGFEDPGSAGVRIDLADATDPRAGDVVLPAVRRDSVGVYLDDWRITAAQSARVAVFASCRQGKRIVAARFPSVLVDPLWPLRLSDRAPNAWRLRREDGRTVAEAEPFIVRGKDKKAGKRLACAA